MKSSVYRRGKRGSGRGATSFLTSSSSLAALLCGVVWPHLAHGQTQLPTIVVTSPSPVASKPPKAQPPVPATGTQSVEAAASAAAVNDAAGDPVEAVGSPPAMPPRGLLVVNDAFVPVSVVTAPEIEARGSGTLGDTLMAKPGVSSSAFAAGASRPIIRGLDNSRVRVQEDGIGSHDASTLSEDHAVPVDPFAADRVEVVRGPATLRYGSQAIGGVVSVENSRIPTFVPRHGLRIETRGGMSSVDNGRDGGFSVTAGVSGVVVHADAYRRRSKDYDTPHGKQPNTYVDTDTHSVGGSFVWSSGFIGIAHTHYASLYGIPGAEALEHFPRIDLEQDKIRAKGEWRPGLLGIAAIRFWYGASDYAHNEVITEDGETLIGTRFESKESEGRAEVEHAAVMTALGELRGAAGIHWGQKKIAGFAVDEPVDGLLDPAKSRMIAGFLFEELQVSQALRFQVAARIEQAHVDGRGYSDITNPLAPALFQGKRDFMPVSASAAALYALPLGIVARVNAQHVERAPEAQELFSKGVHEATGTFEIGNPHLSKELAKTAEVGLKRASGALRFDASAFYTAFDGFIFKRLTGEGCGETLADCGVEDELDQVVFTQRDATFRGVELAAEYDVSGLFSGVWGVDGQYDFVHATFAGGEKVPRIPPHRVGGGIFYRDANWFARVGVLHAMRQKETAPNETETGAYTLLSAELSTSVRLEGDAQPGALLRIGVRSENLLDEEVRHHTSFKKDEVLAPGASVRLFGSVALE